MKIRTGFVSNSSSSSFVLIIETKAYKDAHKKADSFTKEVLDAMNPVQVKLDGADLMVSTTYMGGGGDPTLELIDYTNERPQSIEDPNEPMSPFEAIDIFTSSLPEGSYYEHTGYN